MTGKLRWLAVTTIALLALFSVACEKSEDSGEAEQESSAEITEDGPSSIDHGGIEEFPDDPELAAEGEELFGSKGCAGCHQMDRQTPTGPALGDVTERRTAPWIARQILHPTEMQELDPTNQEVGADFSAPMISVNLTPEEVEAIIAYLASQ